MKRIVAVLVAIGLTLSVPLPSHASLEADCYMEGGYYGATYYDDDYYDESCGNVVVLSSNSCPSLSDALPLPTTRYYTFITAVGATETGDLARDFREALAVTLGYTATQSLGMGIQNLFQEYCAAL